MKIGEINPKTGKKLLGSPRWRKHGRPAEMPPEPGNEARKLEVAASMGSQLEAVRAMTDEEKAALAIDTLLTMGTVTNPGRHAQARTGALKEALQYIRQKPAQQTDITSSGGMAMQLVVLPSGDDDEAA